MSRYFDALNRLRKGREGAPLPELRLADGAEPASSRPYGELSAGSGLSFPELQLASRQVSYAALLDILRATCKGSTIPAVVVAGLSGGEPVHEVVAGIDLQAQRQGIALRCGHLDLTTGARRLCISSRHPLRDSSSLGSTDDRGSFRLLGSARADALSGQIERAVADSELLIIEAPPLGASVEAALLGGACAGLVLVAEALVTKRATLQDGIERARLADTDVLGLVLAGTTRWLPDWVSRLVDLVGRA